MTSVQMAYCSLGKKLSHLCHFWTLSVTKNKWNVNTGEIYILKKRTRGVQLLLTYFHTGSLLKVATNCLRLISQECAIEINAW